jgi:hypothetical protein
MTVEGVGYTVNALTGFGSVIKEDSGYGSIYVKQIRRAVEQKFGMQAAIKTDAAAGDKFTILKRR